MAKAAAKKKAPAEKPAKAAKAVKTAKKAAAPKKEAKAAKARKEAPRKKEKKPRSKADHPVAPVPVEAEADRSKGKSLLIVESPAKAKTIKKYLGNAFTVKASVGHIKDLPSRSIGVDVDDDFNCEYQVISGKSDVVNDLKHSAGNVDRVYLATDPDREGEAIAWHIKEEIEDVQPNIYRVRFNEITPKAIKESLAHPDQLDDKRYESQQSRRILDRLVGYQISPILWKKVKRGLSAGRVQSVAVRLIVERERAIQAFKPVEYWTLDAELEKPGVKPPFLARLSREKGVKLEIPDGTTATRLEQALQGGKFVVEKVEKKERQRRAQAPFITSRLQQDAANRLHFPARKTMQVAQSLYEGVELGEEGAVGLITYMRTDSTRLSDDAVTEVRGYIQQTWGAEYLPPQPNVFKTKANAQDAHEAIRPTSIKYTPESVAQYLNPDQVKLYRLIWDRFVACQMMPARFDQTSVDIQNGDLMLRATGSVMKFAGYLRVYGEVEEEGKPKDDREQDEDALRELPLLEAGDALDLRKLAKEQHFTQPPPRFTEATLVKELEEKGIGRPSTYAAILSTIVDKEYCSREQNRFRPTELGTIVTDLLVESFPDILDVQFTASMEGKLDEVEEGRVHWKTLLTEFYTPFRKSLAVAQEQMKNLKRQEVETDIICEKDGGKMVIKWGKNGSFLACKNYPECKNTKDMKRDDSGELKVVVDLPANENCPRCSSPMVVKNGRFGRFVACSRYPECKTTKPFSTGVPCPTCSVGMVGEKRSRKGKVFFGCNRWPDCSFVLWDRPVKEACPQCNKPFLVEKFSKKTGKRLQCVDKECGYSREVPDDAPAYTSLTPAPAPTA
ncbi:MAG: type I DNA topoisomerase [Deltaproteobacteria bacterium]|nr:type I DNA topoisomerase [Deltaproteobacteria bacterium]